MTISAAIQPMLVSEQAAPNPLPALDPAMKPHPLTEHTHLWGLGHQFDDSGNTLCDALVDKLRVAGAGHVPDATMLGLY